MWIYTDLLDQLKYSQLLTYTIIQIDKVNKSKLIFINLFTFFLFLLLLILFFFLILLLFLLLLLFLSVLFALEVFWLGFTF